MNIVIVDDDKLVAISLKTIIEADAEICVSGIGYNGKEAVSLYESLLPDILLMDIRMEIMSGLEAGETILGKYPHARILYLTTFADDEYIIKALRIGAKGYILKQNYESIVPSLKAVFAGQNVFGEDIVSKMPYLLRETRHADLSSYCLSEKETEIVRLIAEGLSNKEIANRLFLSEGTIRNNISVILDKMVFNRRTQLAVFYYKNMH